MPYKDLEKQKEYNAKYRQSEKGLAYAAKAKAERAAKKRTDHTRKIEREYYLMKTYNISLEHYNKMWADQNGCCAICGIHSSALPKSLMVDHCHATGAVRGLLCNECNLGVGKFKDNITTLQNAIKYLGGNNGNE